MKKGCSILIAAAMLLSLLVPVYADDPGILEENFIVDYDSGTRLVTVSGVVQNAVAGQRLSIVAVDADKVDAGKLVSEIALEDVRHIDQFDVKTGGVFQYEFKLKSGLDPLNTWVVAGGAGIPVSGQCAAVIDPGEALPTLEIKSVEIGTLSAPIAQNIEFADAANLFGAYDFTVTFSDNTSGTLKAAFAEDTSGFDSSKTGEQTAVGMFLPKVVNGTRILNPDNVMANLQVTVRPRVLSSRQASVTVSNGTTFSELAEQLAEQSFSLSLSDGTNASTKAAFDLSGYSGKVYQCTLSGTLTVDDTKFLNPDEVKATASVSVTGSSGGGSGGGSGSGNGSGSVLIPPVITPTPGTDDSPEPDPVTGSTLKFHDLDAFSYAVSDIEQLAERGILSGKGEGTFEPGSNMKRSEFTKVIVEAFGFTAEDGEGPSFADVGEAHWAYGYIRIASGVGLVKGKDEGNFDPEGVVTREQAAAIIARALEQKAIELPEDAEVSLLDWNVISAYAVPYVERLVKAGVINGRDDGTFDPHGTLLRADAACMINRMMTKAGI